MTEICISERTPGEQYGGWAEVRGRPVRMETEDSLVLFSPISPKETYWRAENSFFAKPLNSTNADLGWGGRATFGHLRSRLVK